MTSILGINAYHGDASAALFVDGVLVAAVEEERFTRLKHDTSFPHQAIRYCLDAAGLRPRGHRPLRPVARPDGQPGQACRPRGEGPGRPQGRRAPCREPDEDPQREADAWPTAWGSTPKRLKADPHFVEHHLAHIASSYYVSPFDRAAVLSIDGFGDMISAMWGVGEGGKVRILGEVSFPHSLGVYYTAVTQYLGFHRYGDEYKVMGLASYGDPTYMDEFRQIVHGTGLGYDLNLEAFKHHIEGAAMTWDGGSPELPPLWGPGMEDLLGPARSGPEVPIEERHQNIAASLQKRLEEVVLGMLNDLHAKTGIDALCMAGGVALNCVVNGKILDETPFTDLYIQPAAYDGGTSLGAAAYVAHHRLGMPRTFVMDHAYWGPEYADDRMRSALENAGVAYEECRRRRRSRARPTCSPTAASWAGSKAGWSSARGRSATARSWPTRAGTT